MRETNPDEDTLPDQPMNRFLPVGMCTVDYRGVAKSLRCAGFYSVLCVDLDNPPVYNYHTAMVSRNYIHNALEM